MKRTLFPYFTLLVLLILTSCGSDSPKQDDTPLPKIEFIGGDSSSSIVFGSSGGNQSVQFRTSESWKVTIDGQGASNNWLSASPSSGGEGLVTVTLTAGANEDKENRNCKVVITTPHDKAYVDVSQMQKDALVVSRPSFTLTDKGGKIEIEVGHNVDFDIEISADWIQQVNNSRAYTTEKLVFQVGANTGQNRRIGAVTFTSKDKKITQKVRIIQESKESENLNENYVPVDWKENKLVKCDPKNGVYSFVASAKNEPQLEKGSVFVVDVDTMAYIAIAKEVNVQNNVTTVKTIQGSMADIFHNLNFTLTTKQTPNKRSVGNNVFYPTKVFVQGKNGFVPQSPVSRANSSFTGDLWSWGDNMNGLELFKGSHYKVYLERSEYNLSIDLQMDFNFGGIDEKAIVIDGIKRFLSKNLEVTASIIGTASTTQKIRADISGESMTDISNGELIKRNIFSPKVVIFNVYGVPVSIVLHSDLYLGGWVKAKGKVNAWAGFTDTFTGTLGIGWKQKTNAISPIIEHNNSVGLITPTIKGKGTADVKACIFPRVCTSLYGILGPSFDIKPFVRDSINGGFHEELLSSTKDYCAWNMNLFAGVDLDAGLRINFITNKDNPKDYLLSESNLPDSWKKWMYNEKHIYETPVDIELSKGNPTDIQKDKPIDVEFTVFDNFYLLKEPKQKTCLPQLVKFEGKGNLKSKYGIAKDGLVTAQWTPSSATDSLRAILYDVDGNVMKEAVYKAKKEFKIQKESGDQQTGIPGEPLDLPLKVSAFIQNKDHNTGSLGKEYQVRFKVVSGGGSVSKEFTQVDTYNIAATSWTLGMEGEQKVEAVIVDAETHETVSDPVCFTAQMASLSLYKVSGDGQEGKENEPLSSPLVVGVSSSANFDASSCHFVKYTVVSGGGRLSNEKVSIDSRNQASTTWTLGSGSMQQVRVSLVSFVTGKEVGTPVYFTARIHEEPEPDGPTPGLWIDLGLPSGTKWASHNVGATSPEGYGEYFAWGEISPKAEYTRENSLTYRKHMGDISGNPQYDAATANWGAPARMPTIAECEELVRYCISVWTTHNGVIGCLVTGSNGNSIFLPAAGLRYGTSLSIGGEYGNYWSSTPDEDIDYDAYYLYFYGGAFGWDWDGRDYGRSVRPVRN